MIRVVYDTNIVVSAALKPGSIPAFLLALALEQQVRLCLSSPIWEEYRAVLRRPKFGLSPHAVERMLQEMHRTALLVHPTQRLRAAPHEPDNRFLECAQEARAAYLVTGNTRHFPFPVFQGVRILGPAAFAAEYASLQGSQ
jgi:uncharacterized protein